MHVALDVVLLSYCVCRVWRYFLCVCVVLCIVRIRGMRHLSGKHDRRLCEIYSVCLYLVQFNMIVFYVLRLYVVWRASSDSLCRLQQCFSAILVHINCIQCLGIWLESHKKNIHGISAFRMHNDHQVILNTMSGNLQQARYMKTLTTSTALWLWCKSHCNRRFDCIQCLNTQYSQN